MTRCEITSESPFITSFTVLLYTYVSLAGYLSSPDASIRPHDRASTYIDHSPLALRSEACPSLPSVHAPYPGLDGARFEIDRVGSTDTTSPVGWTSEKHCSRSAQFMPYQTCSLRRRITHFSADGGLVDWVTTRNPAWIHLRYSISHLVSLLAEFQVPPAIRVYLESLEPGLEPFDQFPIQSGAVFPMCTFGSCVICFRSS